jgi:hypothetical protein
MNTFKAILSKSAVFCVPLYFNKKLRNFKVPSEFSTRDEDEAKKCKYWGWVGKFLGGYLT